MGGILCKLSGYFRIEAGCKTNALRPFADLASAALELRAGILCSVPRIGGEVDRNTVRQCFRSFLQLIAPLCGDFRAFYIRQQNMTDVFVLQKFLLFARSLK